jgi:lipopolysaccharide/colanic/teichoic acid biosynthesis glycosyltransferase
MAKRVLDVAVSAILLLFFAAPMLVIMAILRLTGEGEVFFRQTRVGLGGHPISVTKFATMLKNSPQTGTRDITLPNDPRVLALGKFLRRTKLNELPQLWDVLVGKLSLVGWRPLMPQGFAMYPDTVRQEIIKVKPGLTGIGSVVFRDEESLIKAAQAQGRDLVDCFQTDIMPYKGLLEVWYVANRGLRTDLKILACTAIAVVRPGWSGYRRWFGSLPEPSSDLIRRCLDTRSMSRRAVVDSLGPLS